MSAKAHVRIALVGKPNSGKSSLFNQLTGLNQKIGNFPGVTVDKRTGLCALSEHQTAEIIDLPGLYSIYPRTPDEKIVTELLVDTRSKHFPDKVVLVLDATNLKNGLLLLTQLIDLEVPLLVALNMMDQAAQAGISLDVKKLSAELGVPVVMLNAREGVGIDKLKQAMAEPGRTPQRKVFTPDASVHRVLTTINERFGVTGTYRAFQFLQQPQHLLSLSRDDRAFVEAVSREVDFFPAKYQGAETVIRYQFIQDLLDRVVLKAPHPEWKKDTYRIDALLTHKVWGYVIFFVILFLIFQSIFAWAQVPMDFIDHTFAQLSLWLSHTLPAGPFFDLLSQGVVPGIGGIVIFIPQIAILFAFISVLEETGYMARVVFLMDKGMRQFGLNGKSVVPLMSGWACAIPAIMATRTIDNWKERLITIFVTPFMSCSARLPVFTILVALIIPEEKFLGVISYQGLALMGLYLLGFIAALLSAVAMKMLIQAKERSYLLLELPTYRVPKWSNVGYTIVEKTKAFVLEAGKVILAISILLWVLASYGPGDVMEKAEETVRTRTELLPLSEGELEAHIAAYKLEHSYAGIIGRAIEPAIRPLGYDWKIGIALITSFAAREVFVGTIATIYSLGSTEDAQTIKSRLAREINPETGGPRFTPAVGFSLLVFYTFAMQCMSTLAVVKRETKGWKWPLLQLAYMTALAYLAAFVTYHVLR
ncbi:MAG: ferrous iron transport protein B [Cyclobacteriaceae bacterium]|jgi:ferrous iron transport protein B|nr:ferrous iron transport protein B [Cyclobacteriaceae bacterium]